MHTNTEHTDFRSYRLSSSTAFRVLFVLFLDF